MISTSCAHFPGTLVKGVQLNDGPLAPEADLMEATLHDRRLPGDGEFDLTGLVAVLDAIGADVPYGVEVFSDELHALSPADAAAVPPPQPDASSNGREAAA